MESTHTAISQLPLHTEHQSLGAKLGTFGSWEVPLYYTSILAEHKAVRESCGVFDISHMGEFLVEGEEATAFLDYAQPRNIRDLKPGKAAYTWLLTDQGTCVDDIIIYKVNAKKYWIIVNAANVDKDFSRFQSLVSRFSVSLQNKTPELGLLSIQGPKSAVILEALYPSASPSQLPYYGFTEIPGGMIARTGYTGEDGFEVMIPNAQLTRLWKQLTQEYSATPIGFGARDTLRLEAAMPLYGHELDEETTFHDLGFERLMDASKDYAGKNGLQKSSSTKKLIGLVMQDKMIPRQGYALFQGEEKLGAITSGTLSPTLQKNIAMGFVSRSKFKPESPIEVEIRGKKYPASVCSLPFYSRAKKSGGNS